MGNLAVSEYTTFGNDLKVIHGPPVLEVQTDQDGTVVPKKKLLIVGGVHGDETEFIPDLFVFLMNLSTVLTELGIEWTFLPIASYSANQLGTQNMDTGENMNRSFDKEPAPPEVQQLKDFIRANGPYDLAVSFHGDEDLVHNQTYVYGEGLNLSRKILQEWRDDVKDNGGRLLHGYDDPNDPDLGMFAFQGYIRHRKSHETPQMFESWLVNEEHTKQAITVELPIGESTDTEPSDREQKKALLKASLRLIMTGKGKNGQRV